MAGAPAEVFAPAASAGCIRAPQGSALSHAQVQFAAVILSGPSGCQVTM